jgi:hypothetical protein
MGVAADLYVPRDKEISFVDIFAPQGFQVTISARKLADGSRTPVYRCARAKERFGLILLPVRDNPHYTGITLLARPRRSETLISAMETLQRYGALNQTQYDATRIT